MVEILNDSVTSTTTAAALTIPTDGVNDVRLSLNNHGANTVYLGGSAVSASTGFPILPRGAYEWPVRVASGDVYHLTESGTSDLRWMGIA